MKPNIPVFSKLCYLQKSNFINLPLNSLTPNFVASFVFWGTAFSLCWSNFDSETSTNLAAILKTASLQCYNHRAVIIARWSEAPSQSKCSIFDDHQWIILIIHNPLAFQVAFLWEQIYKYLLGDIKPAGRYNYSNWIEQWIFFLRHTRGFP